MNVVAQHSSCDKIALVMESEYSACERRAGRCSVKIIHSPSNGDQ